MRLGRSSNSALMLAASVLALGGRGVSIPMTRHTALDTDVEAYRLLLTAIERSLMGCGDRFRAAPSGAVGPLQLTVDFVCDVNGICALRQYGDVPYRFTADDRQDREKSFRMAAIFWSHYQLRTDSERVAALFDGIANYRKTMKRAFHAARMDQLVWYSNEIKEVDRG